MRGCGGGYTVRNSLKASVRLGEVRKVRAMATAKSKRPSGSKPASGKGASGEEDSTAPKGYPLKSQREAAQRLIAMGGSAPGMEDIPRRRSEPSPEWARYWAQLEEEEARKRGEEAGS